MCSQDISPQEAEFKVELVSVDSESVEKLAAVLLFEQTHFSLNTLKKYIKSLPEEDINRILDAASLSRENRRHKSPRALENIYFTFEIVADFGIYRDLQRHRMLMKEYQ